MILLKLAKFRLGRVFLHARCWIRSPRHRMWHWEGIRRELGLSRRKPPYSPFPWYRAIGRVALLAAGFQFFPAPLAAQAPVFSVEDLPSNAGQKHRAYILNNADVSPWTGPVSSPARWDFSGVTSPDVHTIETVPVTESPFGASFPDADYAERTTRTPSGNEGWEFYRIEPGTGRRYFGLADEESSPIQPVKVFRPSTIDLPDNLTLGVAWSRALEFNDTLDLGFLVVTLDVSFSSSARVDAYGTLVLPGLGEVPAVRVNEVNTYITSTAELGPLADQHFRNYYWLVKGIGKAVHIVSKESPSAPPESFATAATLRVAFEADLPRSERRAVEDLTISLRGHEPFLTWRRDEFAKSYRIEAASDPDSAAWEIAAELTDNFWFDRAALAARRYYRVWAQ